MERTELFIAARSAYHADPTKNRRGCWKRGDPVMPYPEGFARGDLERLPRFWRVRIPVPVWVLQEYCSEHWYNAVIDDPHDFAAWQKMSYWARRKHTFDPRLLPLNESTALYAGAIVDLSWSSFRAAIFVKDPGKMWTLEQAAEWHTNHGHRHVVTKQHAFWFTDPKRHRRAEQAMAAAEQYRNELDLTLQPVVRTA